jgi:2-polyprenyl-6-hydroxyphenyl methylase/3-demethylubiquinone-9 3-methyltransferase
MHAYYEDRLSGDGLRKCYEIAPPRIHRYLDAEVRFVAERVRDARSVIELGCGYGRVLREIGQDASRLVGCDTSRRSLELARSYVRSRRNISLVWADASRTPFSTGAFDATVCIQNGISAFGADPKILAAEALRVTRPGGVLLFSSYAARIWEERLAWFRGQAAAGLIGEIDETRTRDGTIVCKDGFRATTVDGAEFMRLFAGPGRTVSIEEVDGSSLFCTVSTGTRTGQA